MADYSICIICQDEEETLPYTLHCVERVLGTRPRLKQVVIVDGGSQDHTIDVIKHFQLRLPITFLERPFDTPGVQKNFALEHCTGDWVLQLDADMTFTNNFGSLFASGYFDHHHCWDFRLYYTVIDEFHVFDKNMGLTTKMWRRDGHRFTRDFHEEIDIPRPERKQCNEIHLFENSHLQSRYNLEQRGVRWQPHSAAMVRVGPGPGGPERYVKAEKRGRAGAVSLPDDVKKLVVPRKEFRLLRQLDEWRAAEAGKPPGEIFGILESGG